MSNNYGFDFNNDGKVSFTESYLTYRCARDTIAKNSDNRRPRTPQRSNFDGRTSAENEKGGKVFGMLLLLSMLGFIGFFIELAVMR